MSPMLTFNSRDTTACRIELEALRKDKDAQGLFARCLREDINAPMTIQVMKSLSHSWFFPKDHGTLWNNLSESLKLYKRPCKSLLFNSSLLPGNGIATSATTSLDGNTFAYLTNAAVSLEELETRRPATKVEYEAALARGPDKDQPIRINIISISPYRIRSIAIDPKDGFPWGTIPRLLGLDDDFVYVMADEANGQCTFIKVPCDGSPRSEAPLVFNCPGHCVHFDQVASRLWYIDRDTKALVESGLDGRIIHRSTLHLPDDLAITQLNELVIARNGKSLILSVDQHYSSSRYVFALGSRNKVSSGDEAEGWSVRWLRAKELLGTSCLTNCLVGPAFDNSGTACGGDAFYCLDQTGLLNIVDLGRIEDEATPLADLDSSSLLVPCGHVGTKGKSWATGVALATSLPLAASFSMETNSIQIWDLARKDRLFELACPYHIDDIYFLNDDRLLVTVERSKGNNHGTIALSFLDYALLMGKPPVLYNAKDYVRLKPLLAIAPDDPELRILEQLIRYFASTKVAPSSTSIEGKESRC